jgi:hypothetical protein
MAGVRGLSHRLLVFEYELIDGGLRNNGKQADRTRITLNEQGHVGKSLWLAFTIAIPWREITISMAAAARS